MTTAGGFLLDTNVISELRRPRPEAHVVEFVTSQPHSLVFLSAITIAEIEKGIHLTSFRDEKKALLLRRWLETQVIPRFAQNILPFDLEVARAWGLLTGTELSRRQSPSPQDSLIAATAYAHRLTLVTRNKADFQAFPINVLNPWEWKEPG